MNARDDESRAFTHVDSGNARSGGQEWINAGGASLSARTSSVTSASSTQIARATLSDFRHLVHTFRRLGVPLTRARTR